jgi:hypothetical protein
LLNGGVTVLAACLMTVVAAGFGERLAEPGTAALSGLTWLPGAGQGRAWVLAGCSLRILPARPRAGALGESGRPTKHPVDQSACDISDGHRPVALEAPSTAPLTIDSHVSDGDSKLWGVVHNVPDPRLHHRYADWLFQETRFDLRGQAFTEFYARDLAGASSVEVGRDHLDIRIWKPGEPERVVRKH